LSNPVPATTTFFVRWSCNAAVNPGQLLAGVGPDIDPFGSTPTWTLDFRGSGLRLHVGPVGPQAGSLGAGARVYHRLSEALDQGLMGAGVRKRVAGLRVAMPPQELDPAALQTACELAAPLAAPLLMNTGLDRLAIAIREGQLRLGRSGDTPDAEFDTALATIGHLLYVLLRDLSWQTLPPGLPRWPATVSASAGGVRLLARAGGPPPGPVWAHATPHLIQAVPDRLLGRVRRLLTLEQDGPQIAGGSHQTVVGNVLAGVEFFSPLTPGERLQLAASSERRSVPPGATLFRKGDPGRSLFLVEKGEVVLSTVDAAGAVRQLAALGNGGVFGEMSLLTGEPRPYDAKAQGFVTVLEIDRDALGPILQLRPQLAEALSRSAEAARAAAKSQGPSMFKRVRNFFFGQTLVGASGAAILGERDELIAAMKRLPIFGPLTPDEVEKLAYEGRRSSYGAGQEIFHQDEEGRSLFIVEAGRLAVISRGQDGVERQISVLEPGSLFGEMAVLTGSPRGVTVRATGFVEVLEITREDLLPLMRARPELVQRIAELMTSRGAMDTMMDFSLGNRGADALAEQIRAQLNEG
jgi:CRP-like cAMP-binding protein